MSFSFLLSPPFLVHPHPHTGQGTGTTQRNATSVIGVASTAGTTTGRRGADFSKEKDCFKCKCNAWYAYAYAWERSKASCERNKNVAALAAGWCIFRSHHLISQATHNFPGFQAENTFQGRGEVLPCCVFCQTLNQRIIADDSMIIIHSTSRANFAPRGLRAEKSVLLEGRSVC